MKKLRPDIHLVYIGQTGDHLADIPAQHPAIDEVRSIRAGKFRRYHGEGLRQFLDIPTQVKNIRDAFWVLFGIWQSYWLMRRLKPAMIFSRGGFVSVPVCLGGKLSGAPYITHDADSVPSLANRIIARWAKLHAVSLPEELYPYPRQTTVMVGVPVSSDFKRTTLKLQHSYRSELHLENYQQVLLVTGGGNGADRLNKAVARSAHMLLGRYPKLVIIHIAGRALKESVSAQYDHLVPANARQRVVVKGFVSDFYRYSGAADLVIGRAGATNLAEFAIQHKACIIVPATHLVGGHQVKNASVMAARHAIEFLSPDEADTGGMLEKTVSELLDNHAKRARLGEALGEFARPDAARRLAMVLLEQAK